MLSCSSCGATLDPHVTACPYCGTFTAEGVRQRQQQERVSLAMQHKTLGDAEASLKQTSKLALIWSIVSVVICCFPVSSVVGLALSLRARKLARRHGLVIPTQATVALVLSLCGFALFAGLIV